MSKLPAIPKRIVKKAGTTPPLPRPAYQLLAQFIADQKVQCAACDANQIGSTTAHEFGEKYAIRWFQCLGCKQVNIEIGEQRELSSFEKLTQYVSLIFRYPFRQHDFHLHEKCPATVASDFREAAKLLAISPMASGAFARRCLQALLREQGYGQKDLVDQISALLKETGPAKVVPHYITSSVDAIRHFGNFSAHPIRDINTATIIEVEPREAEWCIEILKDLIEHYYERPEQEQAKVDAINEKLKTAGKPPIKRPAAHMSSDAAGQT